MKKIILPMAMAWVLALGVAAPGLAAERNADAVGDGSRNLDNQCDSILASKHGQAPAYIRYCENRQ